MPSNSIPDSTLLKQNTIAYLKNVICDALSVPLHQLDEHTAFERYGLDSILVVQLTNKLRETFPNISTTLFFECNTVAELSQRLADSSPAITDIHSNSSKYSLRQYQSYPAAWAQAPQTPPGLRGKNPPRVEHSA